MLQVMKRVAKGAPREKLRDGRVAARLRAVGRPVGAHEVHCHVGRSTATWDFDAFDKDGEPLRTHHPLRSLEDSERGRALADVS